jgi:hypothetical protein
VGKNFAVLDIFFMDKKYIKDGKVLAHFLAKLKVMPGSLTDISA